MLSNGLVGAGTSRTEGAGCAMGSGAGEGCGAELWAAKHHTSKWVIAGTVHISWCSSARIYVDSLCAGCVLHLDFIYDFNLM